MSNELTSSTRIVEVYGDYLGGDDLTCEYADYHIIYDDNGTLKRIVFQHNKQQDTLSYGAGNPDIGILRKYDRVTARITPAWEKRLVEFIDDIRFEEWTSKQNG